MGSKFGDPEELLDKRRDEHKHGRREDQDRSERPSWRDLDRKRDRSSHTAQDQDLRKPPGDTDRDRYRRAQAEKEAKAGLQGLFQDHAADALRAAILGAEDRAALLLAVDAYLEQKGALPQDGALLERAMDIRKDRTLRQIVEAVAAYLPNANAESKAVLLLKLRARARTTFDRRLGSHMKALLAEHGAED